MKKDAGVTTGARELLPGDFAGGFPIGELLKPQSTPRQDFGAS